jgi:hypothetical protein
MNSPNVPYKPGRNVGVSDCAKVSLLDSLSPTRPQACPSSIAHFAHSVTRSEQVNARFTEMCQFLYHNNRYVSNPILAAGDAEIFILSASVLTLDTLAVCVETNFPGLLISSALKLSHYNPKHPDLPTLFWATESLFTKAYRKCLHLLPLDDLMPHLITLVSIDSPLSSYIMECFCVISKKGFMIPYLDFQVGLVKLLIDLAHHGSLFPEKVIGFFNSTFSACADPASIQLIVRFYGEMYRMGPPEDQLLALHGLAFSLGSTIADHFRACLEIGVDQFALLAISTTEKQFIEIGLHIFISLANRGWFGHLDPLYRLLPGFLDPNSRKRSLLALQLADALVRICPDFLANLTESGSFAGIIACLAEAPFESRIVAAALVSQLILAESTGFVEFLLEQGVFGLLLPICSELEASVAAVTLRAAWHLIDSGAGEALLPLLEESRAAIEAVAESEEDAAASAAVMLIRTLAGE